MVLLAANPLTVSSFVRQAWQSYLSQQCVYTARQGHACMPACVFVCVCVPYVCSVGGEGGEGGCLHLFRKHSSNVT